MTLKVDRPDMLMCPISSCSALATARIQCYDPKNSMISTSIRRDVEMERLFNEAVPPRLLYLSRTSLK